MITRANIREKFPLAVGGTYRMHPGNHRKETGLIQGGLGRPCYLRGGEAGKAGRFEQGNFNGAEYFFCLGDGGGKEVSSSWSGRGGNTVGSARQGIPS